MKIRTLILAFAALALTCAVLRPTTASADLRVHPKRVIFEGSSRSATVTLVNNDPQTYTYRIVWQMLRMNADGKLVRVESEADGEGLKSAESMIRYAPRQVTVEPGVAQTVRLMLRKPKDLADGEYRAHLLFLREPQAITMGSEDDGLAISLNILYGLSIPVFVRQGEPSAEVSIEKLEAARQDDALRLGLHLGRTGERSIYGDVTVTWTDGKADELVLSTVRGIGLYPEIDSRLVKFDLAMPDGSPVPPGTVHVRYRAPAARASKTLAEATLAVN